MSHAEYLNDYEAKHQILEVGRRMYEKGFVASNDGNISCRVSETELWTTPTGVSKGFMTEEMLVKVDLDGVLLANHGALTWGKDPEQAYMRMESLEYYATVSMYTGHIIGQANELTCEQVDRLVDTRTRLGIQSGGRPVCRHAEAGEPRPCECGLCNLTPAALSELICHLIATLPEDVIRLLRHSS